MTDRDATLDPEDWSEWRALGHRMLDDMFDYQEHVRGRPVWQPIPDAVRERFRSPLPLAAGSLQEAHGAFLADILPYAVGNAHPGFMGWVHGGGTPVGMLADMLAGGLNANVGGRDQMPVEVERQMTRWMAELFGFPATASGLFVTGSSMANFIATLVARTKRLGAGVRCSGVAECARLVAYASTAAHRCIAQAMEMSGHGSCHLHAIPTDSRHRMDVDALVSSIEADRRQGQVPFLVVGTAGTVDVGAIDPLAAIADVAAREDLWFHVDGACGALARMSARLAPLLDGIERADSIAFDFHKWAQVPYDAGFVLVRDSDWHRRTFASPASYLRRQQRGLAAGDTWPCDFGPDLSRGFRALKTWFTLKVYGTERLGRMMDATCGVARYLADTVQQTPQLELAAPVALNVVCFGYRCPPGAESVNEAIAAALQEAGIAAPSTTTLNGRAVLRAAIVNHRTRREDVDALIDATVRFGGRFSEAR
jgi:aromatic-L-amino-acid decarboxylase